MLDTLSVDPSYDSFSGWCDHEIAELEATIKECLKMYEPVPLDAIARLEQFGYNVNQVIQGLENELYGESDFYNSNRSGKVS